MDDRPICLVYISKDGDIDYLLNGEAVSFFVVDERVPHDRVYRMTKKTPRKKIMALIGGGPIGSRHDARHAAVEHRITRWMEGKKHLETVERGDE